MSGEARDRVEILIDEAAGRLTLLVPTLSLGAFAGSSFGANLRTASIMITELAITFRWPTATDPSGALAVSATTIAASDAVVAWSAVEWSAAEVRADNVLFEVRSSGTRTTDASGLDGSGLIGETALAGSIVDGLHAFAGLVAPDASDPGQPERIAAFARGVLGSADALLVSIGLLTMHELSQAGDPTPGAFEAAALHAEAALARVPRSDPEAASSADASDARAEQMVRVLVVVPRTAWTHQRAQVRAAALRANAEGRLTKPSGGRWALASWRVSQASVGEIGAWNLQSVLATDGAPTRLSLASGSLVGLRVTDLGPGFGTVAWDSLSATMDLGGGAEAKGATGFAAALGQVTVAASGLVVVKVREITVHPTWLSVGQATGAPSWLGAAAGWTIEIPYAERLRLDATFSIPARELSFGLEVASIGVTGARRDGDQTPFRLDEVAQLQRASASGTATFPKAGAPRVVIQQATVQQATIPLLGVTSARVPLLVLGQCRLSEVRVTQLDLGARTGSARIVRLAIRRIETATGDGSLNATMVDAGRAADGRWTVALSEGNAEGSTTLGATRVPWDTRVGKARAELARDQARSWQARWHADDVHFDARWEVDGPTCRARVEGRLVGVVSGDAAGDGSAHCELRTPHLRAAGTVERDRRPSSFECDLRDAVTRVSATAVGVEAAVTGRVLVLGPTRVALPAMTLATARGGEIRDLALRLVGVRGGGLGALTVPVLDASHLAFGDAHVAREDWSFAAPDVTATGLRLEHLVAARTLGALLAQGFHARADAVRGEGVRLTFGPSHVEPPRERAHVLAARWAAVGALVLNPPGATPDTCTAETADAEDLVVERPSGRLQVSAAAMRALSYRFDRGAGAFASARFELDAPFRAQLQSAPEGASHLHGRVVMRLPMPAGELNCTATIADGHVADLIRTGASTVARKGGSPLGTWAPEWLALQTTDEIAGALAARLDVAIDAIAARMAAPGGRAGDGSAGATPLELDALADALTSEADAAAALWDVAAPMGRGLLRLAQDAAETWQPESQTTEIERARAVTRGARREDASAWVRAIHVAFEIGGESQLGTPDPAAGDHGARLSASVRSQLRAAGALGTPLAIEASLVLQAVDAGMGRVSLATDALMIDGARGELAAGTFAIRS